MRSEQAHVELSRFQRRQFYKNILVAAMVALLFAGVLAFVAFDEPKFSGIREGGVVSVGYRPPAEGEGFHELRLITIKLQSGEVAILKSSKYEVGDTVRVRILKSDLTGRVEYEL